MIESVRIPEVRGGRPLIGKVVCYVTRGNDLLVFRHKLVPEAGLQVPAGTIEPGEDPEVAALREAQEETGHSGFRVLRKVGEYTHHFEERPEDHFRHVFHLEPPAGLPERWEHFAENAHWFAFEWVPLGAVPDLAASQGDLLHVLTASSPETEGPVH
jgi:8-oxo-dGTP pyrophosphatase MutT (NUDIX family)